MNTILERIIEQRNIQYLQENEVFLEHRKNVPSLYNALRTKGCSIIAEFKRASPSKGILVSEDTKVCDILERYETYDVQAYSIVTESHYFHGSKEDFEKAYCIVDGAKPLLRKDFITNAIQIIESAQMQASAILLIAGILDEGKLRYLHQLAHDLFLDVIVEVHTQGELEKALRIPQLRIVGINNRDLQTFQVSLDTTRKLMKYIPKDASFCVISESGIQTFEAIKELEALGVDGVLIGEALMKSEVMLRSKEEKDGYFKESSTQ